jgi:hypothetical protein
MPSCISPKLARIVSAKADDPLFSWVDTKGEIRPLVKSKAVEHINNILMAWGWRTAFGHSFRIGGASHHLAEKVDLELFESLGDRNH